MNRQELIENIAEVTGETKAAAGRFLDAFIDTVQDAVASGDKVSMVGFGNFTTLAVKSRKARNPATGELITLEATVRPKFTPGNKFKEMVKDAGTSKG